MPQLTLPVHSYQLRSRNASSARLINCYPEALSTGARAPFLLRRTPGTKTWTTVGDGPIRGIYYKPITFADTGYTEQLYVVSGRKLYSVTKDKTVTELGEVGTPTRVDFASNDDSLVVVNQPKAFVWDGTTFAEITDDDFTSRGAGDVEYLEGYLLFREPNSNRIFGADVNKAADFDALNFVNTNADPDTLIGIKQINRQLVAFGTDTTEMYENTGGAFFPFERIINATMEVGALSSSLIGRTFDQIYWVADDFTVRRLDGNVPTVISTPAVEQFLQNTATISTGRTWGYTQEGHPFFGMTFKEGTWVYDAKVGEWHERRSFNSAFWKWEFTTKFDGKILCGDRDSNKISELDVETYTDNDTPNAKIVEWTYQPIFADGMYAFHDRFEVVLETGVGTTTGQGSDPKIMLEYSDDSGNTWTAMPARTFGKRGRRLDRAVWHGLGRSRERVYRCRISDPVPVTITATLVEVRGGRL